MKIECGMKLDQFVRDEMQGGDGNDIFRGLGCGAGMSKGKEI